MYPVTKSGERDVKVLFQKLTHTDEKINASGRQVGECMDFQAKMLSVTVLHIY